jgi:nitrogenase molybdenum-iron protein beta chain
MARPLVGPRAGCALHGALLTAGAIEGVVPLVHSTPGCAVRAGLIGAESAAYFGAPAHLPPISSTNLAEKHIVFGGTSRLREQIKNTLAILPGGLLVVLTGCPTEMIGDDVAAMVKEVTSQGEAVVDIATAGFRGSSRHGYELLLSGLAERSDTLGAAREPVDHTLVNVLGIVPRVDAHWVAELDEIARILDGLGLRANVVVGPAGGLEDLRALPRASASLVLSPWGLAPARALAAQFGTKIATVDGLPVGFDAVRKLADELFGALGSTPGVAATRFLDAERRYEDFVIDETLEALSATGRRRFAVAAGSLLAGSLSRFLVDTLGWESAATIVTDDPPDASRAGIAAAGESVLFSPDSAEIAQAIRKSGADIVLADTRDRATVGERGVAFIAVSGLGGASALTGGFAGTRGAGRLLDLVINATTARA